jgi:hypothetical protein
MMKLDQQPNVQRNLKALAKKGLSILLGIMIGTGGISEAIAQQSKFGSIVQHFDTHRKKELQEKLYLHIDRSMYACGETMWFKIYNVDGALHHSLDMSKIAYVEVLDATQIPVLQAKVALSEGTGNGSFELPTTLNSGNYTVRAYTNWMKNFSPEFYFEQPVSIINTFKSTEPSQKAAVAGYALQFFPEGGNLLAGAPNKVAFKAVNQTSGKGASFSAVILDEKGDSIASFKSHKFGIGHFTFTPEAAKKYKARVKLADGKVLEQALPEVHTQGYSMQVEEAPENKLRVTVRQASAQGHQVYLLAHARQIVTVNEVGTLQQGMASFLIDKAELADGITHLTVFNEQQQPVCERLFFKHPEQTLRLQVNANKRQFITREKVSLSLETGIVDANLSVAVYRLDSLQQAPKANIESYLWLASDLKGDVEQPAYYFSEAGQKDRVAMDNLMLTHGWSRFKWEDITSATPAAHTYLPEFNGHWLTGKVTHKAKGSPASGVVTYLASPGKEIRFYNFKSDAAGLVRYELKNFYGARDIVLQTDFNRDSTYHFEVFNPFSEKYSTTSKLPVLGLSEELQHEITLRHVNTQVQHAFQGGYKARAPHTDSTTFYGRATEAYLLDDYKRFKVMEEVMREYVPGVQVRRRGNSFRFMVFDRPNKTIFQDNPMVLLDGVPVFDIDKIMAFDPLKVKKLDVVTSRFFHGPLIYPGVVSYQTYTNDLSGFEVDARSLMQAYEGLQLQREFYAPTYQNVEQRKSRLADFRNLLQWSPDVKTTSGEETQQEFYTSDQTGTYLVVVQGMTATGQVGSQVLTIEVKSPLAKQ